MKTVRTILLCITAFYSGISFGESITVAGSGADLATFKLLAEKFSKRNPDIKIKVLPSIGSGGGIKAVREHKIDLCLASRPPKQKELSENLVFKRYAQTPLVFAVNKALDIDNLNTQNIIDIYSGRMTEWSDNLQIKPILRPLNDSDTQILIQNLPDFDIAVASAYKRRGLPIATTDQDALELIHNLQGAIGSSTMSIVETTKSSIKAISFNDIKPIPENLKNGSYKLYKNLYFCHNSDSPLSLQKFIKFILSDEGKNILNKTGHYTFDKNNRL